MEAQKLGAPLPQSRFTQEGDILNTPPVSLYVCQFNFLIQHVLNVVLSFEVVNLECSRVSSGAALDDFAL